MKTKAIILNLITIFILLLFVSQVSLAQSIYKSSIDNGGGSTVINNITILYTIGEVNVREATVGNLHLSEGFIGPSLSSDVIYIPDPNFEQALIDLGIDSDGTINQQMLRSDAEGVTTLNVSNPTVNPNLPNVSGNIADLTGIEAFSDLTSLDFRFNEDTVVDLTQNKLLKTLMCAGNQLTALDISENKELTYILCSNNQISQLDVFQCPNLQNLFCSNNNLSALNVSDNPSLLRLDCGYNQISQLDVTHNIALLELACHSNQLTQLNIEYNTALTKLICEVNQLSVLDLTNNPVLKNLLCGKNQLTTLDVSNNLLLEELDCYYNQLEYLDVTANTGLYKLLCFRNNLTRLDVRNGNNTNITYFNASVNNLTCVDVDDETADHSSWTVDAGVIFSNNCDNNTQRGDDMTVELLDEISGTVPVITKFKKVDLSGNTTLIITEDGPELPDGFSTLDMIVFYDIGTTAEYSETIEVAIEYEETSFENEEALRLLHYTNDQWEDVTTWVDTENNIIYGEVNTLSPFVIVQDVQPPVFSTCADITVNNDPGQAGAIVNFDEPVASDNSSVVNVDQVDETGLTSGSFFPIGTTTLVFQASDGAGNTSECSFNVVVNNPAPVIDEIIAPVDPIALGIVASVDVYYTDDNLVADTIDWGDGSEAEEGDILSNPIHWEHLYALPGVYPVTIRLTDAGGLIAEEVYRYIVVYDPDGGFVTGGGWIYSPAGAYVVEPFLEGAANFGFVSKYKKGSTVPDGNTEFQFKAGNLNFKSTEYEWLVISGFIAQFKGAGTINGIGDFGFLLSAIDADLTPSAATDKFRIKIWNKADDLLVYDNNIESDENAEPSTEINGGSIVIHSTKNKSAEIQNPLTIRDINFVVFPNPFNDRLHFEFSTPVDIDVKIEVYDITGRKVKTVFDNKALSGIQYRVDFHSVSEITGVYMYSVQLGETLFYDKVIRIKK